MDSVQKELSKKSSEVQRCQNDILDAQSLTDLVCRENKNLGDEKQKLLAELDALRSSYHESEKTRNFLQHENKELNLSLDVVRRDLQNSESKKAVLVQEMASYKQEMLLKLGDKEEELQSLK